MVLKEIVMFIYYQRELPPIIIICKIGHILYSYANLFHANIMMDILCEDRLLKVLFCYKYMNMLQMYFLSD